VCTSISQSVAAAGAAKGGTDWFPVSVANVGFDHAVGSRFDHALLLDFAAPARGPSARVAVELDLRTGKALLAALQSVIEQAEHSGAPV
jgi:Family of unknown function (DUF6295)